MDGTTELRDSILLLEIQRAEEKELLREQIKYTCERLKPVNLIRSTYHELTDPPDFKRGIVNTVLGLAAGYISKKVIIGATHNPIKQIVGTLLQYGVSNMVAKNGDGIKSIGSIILKKIFNRSSKPEKV